MAARARAEALLLVFFFQAEDGIRDLTVTGVQTCALPISAPGGALAPADAGRPGIHGGRVRPRLRRPPRRPGRPDARQRARHLAAALPRAAAGAHGARPRLRPAGPPDRPLSRRDALASRTVSRLALFFF